METYKLRLERIIALKMLHSTLVGDKENQQRFTREIGQVARLIFAIKVPEE